MYSSLHRGISENESTHCQGDHPHFSGFIKTNHNPHRRIGCATGSSDHARG